MYIISPIFMHLQVASKTRPTDSGLDFLTRAANPENLRQIFQVKLVLESKGEYKGDFIIPEDLLWEAEEVNEFAHNCNYIWKNNTVFSMPKSSIIHSFGLKKAK